MTKIDSFLLWSLVGGGWWVVVGGWWWWVVVGGGGWWFGSKVEKNQSLSTPISMENFQVRSLLTKGQKCQNRKYLQPLSFSVHYIYIYIYTPMVYMGWVTHKGAFNNSIPKNLH